MSTNNDAEATAPPTDYEAFINNQLSKGFGGPEERPQKFTQD